ncbi:MAG TPA: 2Fe-2S iron-sulfur cluster-binding protein [Sphingobacteriaceae bacterium]|nr:2Fe-2S iron-sulfur cluster-binding protein [Sphingobacteriaceae bacterium]
MSEEIIRIHVEGPDDQVKELEIPDGINLSLMEVLKASEYNILATCGGMALCATCHIQVVDGLDMLDERSDSELDMLDTLPNADDDSRLACQIKVGPQINGLRIRVFDN